MVAFFLPRKERMEQTKSAFGNVAKKVKCLDAKTGKVVGKYDSLTAAAKSVGRLSAKAAILNVCNGYQRTAYGYRWEYMD